MRDGIVCRAKRRIEPGEFVTADDVEFLPQGATVIEVQHSDDVDVKIIATPDIAPAEAVAMVSIAALSPTRVTEAVAVPSHIRTIGDFFDEENGMGRAFAEKLADKIFGPDPCSRCGAGGVKTTQKGNRKLCTDCFPLEF